MSNIVKNYRTYLISKSTTTNVSRIYFGNLPQNPTYPAAVLHLIDTETMRHHGAASAVARSVIQVDCHDNNFTDTETISESIRSVTESQVVRTWGTMTARRAYVTGRRDITESPVDGSQLHQHIRSLDLTVWHTEPLPST